MTTHYSLTWLGRWLIITLGIILCTMPVWATDKPTTETPSSTAILYESAIAFRMLAAVNMEKAADKYQGTKPLACVLKTDAWRKTPQIWKTFFSGAFVIGGNANSASPVFAFYNPLFDGVLLTQWQLTPDPKTGGIITAAAFAKGSDLRGTTVPAKDAVSAAWIDSKRTPPVALAQALQQFITDFEVLYPPAGTSVAALDTMPAGAAHLAVMAAQGAYNDELLALLQEEKYRNVNDVIRSFRAYLAAGDRAKLAEGYPASNPLPLDKLLELPQAVRKELVPVYVAMTDTTWLIFLGVPWLPQFLGILDVAGDQRGWHIRSFGFYDLANPLLRQLPPTQKVLP
ncbi:MAG: hypothetical protein WCQ50_11835 [Spirochaetota bacterium]